MKQAIALTASLVLTLLIGASADARPQVGGGPGAFHVEGEHRDPGHHTSDISSTGHGASAPTWESEPCSVHPIGCDGVHCQVGQQAVLVWASTGLDSVGAKCLGGAAVTAAMVLRAFRRIPVPAPALHIEPVKGRTMVNLPTNFHAGGPHQFRRTVTLLGQRVTLRIHAQSYDFRFGDHGHLTTAEPGAAYPDMVNTHVYLRKGTVHPSLSTTWTADYRVGHGPWRPVNGTVTRATPPQDLEVTTATPVLTGD